MEMVPEDSVIEDGAPAKPDHLQLKIEAKPQTREGDAKKLYQEESSSKNQTAELFKCSKPLIDFAESLVKITLAEVQDELHQASTRVKTLTYHTSVIDAASPKESKPAVLPMLVEGSAGGCNEDHGQGHYKPGLPFAVSRPEAELGKCDMSHAIVVEPMSDAEDLNEIRRIAKPLAILDSINQKLSIKRTVVDESNQIVNLDDTIQDFKISGSLVLSHDQNVAHNNDVIDLNLCSFREKRAFDLFSSELSNEPNEARPSEDSVNEQEINYSDRPIEYFTDNIVSQVDTCVDQISQPKMTTLKGRTCIGTGTSNPVWTDFDDSLEAISLTGEGSLNNSEEFKCSARQSSQGSDDHAFKSNDQTVKQDFGGQSFGLIRKINEFGDRFDKHGEKYVDEATATYLSLMLPADKLLQETEQELNGLRSRVLAANHSIYKLAYDEVVTDQSETDEPEVPMHIGRDVQTAKSPLRTEILVHDVDSVSEAGSEDVEIIPHRYEGSTSQDKHIYVNKLSLAAELLRTQEDLPYDNDFKPLTSEPANPVRVNFDRFDQVSMQAITSGPRASQISTVDSGVQSEESGDEAAEEAEEDKVGGRASGSFDENVRTRRGHVKNRSALGPLQGSPWTDPCLCCAVM